MSRKKGPGSDEIKSWIILSQSIYADTICPVPCQTPHATQHPPHMAPMPPSQFTQTYPRSRNLQPGANILQYQGKRFPNEFAKLSCLQFMIPTL